MAKSKKTMSGLAMGAVLSACMQPGDPSDTEALVAGTEAAPKLTRPTGAVQSPGPGAPSGPVSDLTAAQIPGDWDLVTETAEPVAITLTGREGLSVGQVEVQSAWTQTGPAPTTWLYLAYGQLTLVDEDGTAVWTGEVKGDAFSGTLNATGQTADLVTRAD